MKRSLLALLLATTFAITGSNSTYALHSTDSFAAREQSVRPTEEVITDDKKLEIEARKQELEQKLAEKRASVSEKLLGVRAEKCEKQQVNINSMLDKRFETAQKHFNTFNAIQLRLEELVEDKEIEVSNHSALKLIMTNLGAKAQGSISMLKSTDFKCEDADATAPGAIVKDQVATAKQDLKNYRDAIKDYAQTIKSSVESTTEPSSDETTSEEAPTQEAPSTQQSIEGVPR